MAKLTVSATILAVVLLAWTGDAPARGEPKPYAGKIGDLIAEHPLESKDAPKVTPLAKGEGSSVALIQTLAPVKLHYHETHDETVVVWSGKGKMRLGDETHSVGPGSILFIPRKTLHSFEPTGEEKAVVISSFSPPFDGEDRVFVREEE